MAEGLSRRQPLQPPKLKQSVDEPRASKQGPAIKHDPAAENALEFVAFHLPPQVDWEAFNAAPRRTWCGLYEDPAVEATFVRFKCRPGCVPMIALCVGGALHTGLQYYAPTWSPALLAAIIYYLVSLCILAVFHLEWDAPFKVCVQWRDSTSRKGRSKNVVKPSAPQCIDTDGSDVVTLDDNELLAIRIAETRSAFYAKFVVVFGVIMYAIFSAPLHRYLWDWCTALIPPSPGLDIVTLCHWRIIISAGATSITAFGIRTPFAVIVAACSFIPYLHAYAFGFGILDLLTLLGHCMTNAPLVFGTLYQIHAMDEQDRYLFSTVVAAHCARRAIARHVRAVAATAAAAAPRFAAAQIRGVTVLRGLGRLPSLELSLTTVGITGVADFARWVTGLLPVNVVVSLHALFATYDAAAARHSVDKLGTFGDTYAVSAPLQPRSDAVATGAESSSSSMLEESRCYGAPSPEAFGAAARRVADFVMWQVRVGIMAAQPPGGNGDVTVTARGAMCSGALSCGVIGSAAALRFAATGRALTDARAALEAAPPNVVHIDSATSEAFGAPGEAQSCGFTLFDTTQKSAPPKAETFVTSSSSDASGSLNILRSHNASLPERSSLSKEPTVTLDCGSRISPETTQPIPNHSNTQRSGFDYKAYVAEASKRFALVQRWGTTRFSDPATERKAALFAREQSRIIVPGSAFAVSMLYTMTAFLSLYELFLHRCDFTARLRSVGSAAPFSNVAQTDALRRALFGGWECLLNTDAYPLFPLVLLFLASAMELRRWRGHGVLDTRHAVIPYLVWLAGIAWLPEVAVAAKTVQYSLAFMNQAPHWLPQTTGSVWPRAGIQLVVSLLMLAVHFMRGNAEFCNGPFFVWILCTSTAYVVQTRRSVRVRYQLTEHASTLQAIAARYRETQDRLARALLPPHIRDAALSGIQPKQRSTLFALRSQSSLDISVAEAPSHAQMAHPPPRFSDCLLFPVPDVVVLHMSLRPRVGDRLGGFQAALSQSTAPAGAAATVQSLAHRWEQLLHLAGVEVGGEAAAETDLAESQDTLGDLLGDSNGGEMEMGPAAARVLERQRRQAARLRSVDAARGRPSAAARRFLESVEAFGDEVVFAGPFPHTLGGDQRETDVVLAAHAAVDLCRRASVALARPLGSHDDNGMVFVGGLGAGCAQAALLGNSRLTYRLLGVARREASALLAAAPLPPCGAQSAAFASPAFRRAYEGYGGIISISKELVGTDTGGASRAVRGSVAVVKINPMERDAPAGDVGSAFDSPALWRVRGLGVMEIALVRGLTDKRTNGTTTLEENRNKLVFLLCYPSCPSCCY